MAKRSFFRRIRNGYGRTRVVVKKVYQRTRRRASFLQKNKTLVIVGILAVAGFYFKDKIKAMFAK